MQDGLELPPPISESRACLFSRRSHVASGSKAMSVSFPVQAGCVPELSSSRYLCTSKTRLSVEPSRFLTFANAGPEPEETKDSADVYPVPGSRIV